MSAASKVLIDLETRFWQSMVDHDTQTALDLLSEPALMVSAEGAIKFDHSGYRKMADQDSMVLTSFELQDLEVIFPNSKTAVLSYRVKQGIAPRGRNENVAIQEMNDTSTWIESPKGWRCVMHTETPVNASQGSR